MFLKRNIISNYVSQIYVTLISIVMVPTYVRYMGAEAYGLVGFFAMLLAWFQLLDMGLTPTMGRETARFNGGATDAISLRRLLRAMEGIFIAIALIGGAAMMAGSSAIAINWLKVQELSLKEVQHAIMLIAMIVTLRWVCGLYRSVINGFERLVWLSGFNIAIATARNVLVILIFIYVGTSPTHFFSYQLIVSLVEVAGLTVQAYRLLPKVPTNHHTAWRWAPLRDVLKFSLSIAFTGSIWVLVTQTDKLVLSKLLVLSDYAYFTLAVMAAGGVSIVSSPIGAALLPRLTKLSAEGNESGLISLYRNATQMVAVIAIPAALVLAFFAEQVLWVWTADVDIARKAAPVLTLYALGNGVQAFTAFPYYLQYAKGDLRLHMFGSGLFLLFLIPPLIWATLEYGAIGAGWAWLSMNAIYFMAWVPKVHAKFERGLHFRWLVMDIGLISLPSVVAATFFSRVVDWPKSRAEVLIILCLISLAVFVFGACGLAIFRQRIAKTFQRLRGVVVNA